MAVVVEDDRTTITPTAWKWYTGAGVLTALSIAAGLPGAVIVAAFLALTGTGLVNRVTLDAAGFEYRNYWTRKRFAWNQVTDFGQRTYSVNWISSVKLITFSEVARRDTLYGKFARAVAGGTQTMPVIGIEPRQLLGLISRYSASGAHLDLATEPRPAAHPKPKVREPAAPKIAGRQATNPKPPVSKPVDLVVDGRGRARQTKAWPYA